MFGGIRRDQKDQRGMIKVRDYRDSMVQDLPNVPHPRVPLGMRLRGPCAHRVLFKFVLVRPVLTTYNSIQMQDTFRPRANPWCACAHLLRVGFSGMLSSSCLAVLLNESMDFRTTLV